MELRPYQERMITAIECSISSGHTSPCVVLPVGAGKTAVGLTYLSRHQPGKILWLAPRVSLIDQTWRAMLKFAPELRDRLKVSTVQALLGKSQLPDVDLCVVDECHFFFGSEMWSAIAHAFPRRLALTATPTRSDFSPLRELCDDLLVGPQRRELVSLGHLPPMRTLGPEKKRKTAAWKTVDIYRDHCVGAASGVGERALVFCADVKHAHLIRDEFIMAGIKAGSVTIDSGSDLALHAAGHLDVLTNVYMVSVGYDDPTVSTVILARPFSSPTAYIQACGRARGAFAKEVKILDSFGSFHEWGFADEDRTFSLGDNPIRLKADPKERKIVTCVSCKTAYRLNVYDLRCPHCEGTARTATKKEANREKLLSKYAGDTDSVRFKFLERLVIQVRIKKLPYWIPMANYQKRYGERPPISFLEKLGMREAKPI